METDKALRCWFILEVNVEVLCLRLWSFWGKVFKNGTNKICGRQPLKNLKWFVSLGRPYHFKFFKGYSPQTLLVHSWIPCPIFHFECVWPFWASNFIKKETLAQVLSCEFCKIFNRTFSYRTPLVAASDYLPNISCNG